MPRAKRGFKARRRRNKVMKSASGYRGGRSKLYRTATEAVDKGLQYAYAHRKRKKREMRALWNIRIGAAARINGISYSRFMGNLKKADILLDRKILADIAVNHPTDFASLVTQVK